MDQQIKNSLNSMYQIYDDNNMMDIVYLSSLVNTTSDSKEFSFGGSNIDYIMKSLDDWVIENVDISDQSSYLVFVIVREYGQTLD